MHVTGINVAFKYYIRSSERISSTCTNFHIKKKIGGIVRNGEHENVR